MAYTGSPRLDALAPANGGAGARVVIAGANFGASADAPYSVTFGGLAATGPTRADDQSIVVTVPAGASSGPVVVTVGGSASASKPFAVLGALAWLGEIHAVVPGERHTLYFSAHDTTGAIVSQPAVDFTASGAAVEVSASGVVTAKAAGNATIGLASGTLQAAPYALGVYAGTVAVATVAGKPSAGVFDRAATDTPLYEGIGGAVEFQKPLGVAVGPDGNVFVADNGGWVTLVTPDGVVKRLATVAGAAAIAVQPDGTCVVAAGNALVKVSATGTVTPFVGGTAAGLADGTGAAASFSTPLGLALAKDGTLYVNDTGNGLVRVVSTNGMVTTLPGVTVAKFSGAAAAVGWSPPNAAPIAVASDGSLYVVGSGDGAFQHITLADPTHPIITAVQAPEPRTPPVGDQNWGVATGLALDAKDEPIWCDAYQGIGYVRRVDLTAPASPQNVTLAGFGGYNGHVAADGDGAHSGFQYLTGLARDPVSGAYYAIEQGYQGDQQQLRRITLP